MTGRGARDLDSGSADTAVLPRIGGGPQSRPQLGSRPRPSVRDPAKPHLILFLAANPRGVDALRLGEECAEIQRELKMTPHRDDFRFEARWAVSIDELVRHLTELDPSVLHFSGHGGGSRGLLLQDDQLISARALAMILEAAAFNVRAVVLNACYSAAQAKELRTVVDCVVGMDGAIGDAAARAFAAGFYGALGNRRSIGNAVDLCIAALAAREVSDEMLPIVMTRDGINAYEVVLEVVDVRVAAAGTGRHLHVEQRRPTKASSATDDRDVPATSPRPSGAGSATTEGTRLEKIAASELDAVIERARSAGWRELALLGPSRFRLPSHRVPPAQTFCLREPLGAALSKLRSLVALTTLDLSGNHLGDDDAGVLAGLDGLTSLSLNDNHIRDGGASALAGLRRLSTLDLSGNQIGPDGACALGGLAGLTSLSLSGNRLGNDGVRGLVRLAGLTKLALSDNQIEAEGALAVAELAGLTSLDLRANRIGPSGALALAELTGLTVLALSGNEIGDAGGRALAKLTRLRSLELSANQIGDDGARAMAELRELRSLELSANRIGDEGTRAIAKLHELRSLELSSNQIGPDGARCLAELTALTSLVLNYNEIGDDGARALAALAGLTSLDVIGNGIGDEGARALARLTHLTSLALQGNRIGDAGVQALAGLTALTSLVLSRNRVGDDGACALAQLPRLTSLALIGNQIGDRGARALAGLTRLATLDLSANQIGDRGARALTRLTRLTSLDLRYNPIGADGARALLDAWCDIPTATSLATLDFGGNKALESVLPAEVLASSDAQSILAAYRRYRAAKQVGALRSLNEAKLVVVGNEAVGKTSLIRYLVHGKPRNPDERKTPGTAIHEKIEVSTWSVHHSQVRLHVWDFGGQEIMRGTHRFFLTERSLYLLVLEDRREDDRSIYEWLEVIAQRGGDSPVIIVVNKSDSDVPQRQLDEVALRRTYPAIAGFARTTCNADENACRTIASLREQIATTISESPRLKHVRDPIPQSWLRVKDAIAGQARSQSVLPVRDFERLCEDTTHANDGIITPYEQRALLALLHDLGVVVAHGLRRDATAVRREITVLDPNWLTGAIYALINSPIVREQGGELREDQLGDLLDPVRYPSGWHELVISMMRESELGLCLPIAGGVPVRYLLPDALPVNEPDFGEWPTNALRFRLQYSLLPTGFIPRFIVEAHRSLTSRPTWWRTGVVLGIEGCRILVRGDVARNRVEIYIIGATGQRAALSVVRNYFDAVHRYYAKLPVKERVPLPDKPEVDVGYDHLVTLEREEPDGLDHAFRPEDADRKYSVRELLEGVRDDKVRPHRGSVADSMQRTQECGSVSDSIQKTQGVQGRSPAPELVKKKATNRYPLLKRCLLGSGVVSAIVAAWVHAGNVLHVAGAAAILVSLFVLVLSLPSSVAEIATSGKYRVAIYVIMFVVTVLGLMLCL